ncbi:hypothetical protein [Micromonospora sp. NPDC049645]|uniref:hypothetical protein n=1 Tax=Micromonospora sp. NPDC049645 TaxID=3155508 RepID=UPI003421ECC0
MVYFSAEVLPSIGAVRLVLDVRGWTLHATQVQVRRYLVDPEFDRDDDFTLLRSSPHTVEGDPYAELFEQPNEVIHGDVRVWYDTEAPLDRPVWYRAEMIGGDAPYVDATAAVVLLHSTFEQDLAGWYAWPTGSTAHETAAPLFGAGSLRVTAPGAVALVNASAPLITTGIVPGHHYLYETWLRALSAPSELQVVIDWQTAAGVFISTTGFTLDLIAPVGSTIYRGSRSIAPAGAAQALVRMRWSGTPAAGNAMLFDEVRLLDVGTGAINQGTPVVVPSAGGGWLRDPLAPSRDVRLSLLPGDECAIDDLPSGVIFASYAPESRAGASARYDVVEQALPTVARSVRKAPTSTLTLASLTFADRDRVDELLATGRLLLLQVPPEYGIADRYLDVGDAVTAPLVPDLRTQYRVHDLPHAVTLPPSGPGEAPPGYRWADACDRYTTWNQVDAANITGVDVLLGALSTPASAQ